MVLAALALSMPSAAADDGSLLIDLPGDDVGFTHHPEAPLVGIRGLVPGDSKSTTFALRNTSAAETRVELRVFDLTEVGNDCLPPKVRETGDGCDAAGGDFSDWLTVSVTKEDVGGARMLWTAVLRTS